MKTLKGLKVVVLGGTRGIGLAVASQALEEGAEVVVVSSRAASVDAAVARLRGATGEVADLRDERGIEELFAKIGAFDHLAYTAGENLLVGPIADLDLAAARTFFDVRYWGALAAVRAAHRHLRGSIVLTGGTAGRRPPPGFAIGASLCGAMEALARALAVELSPVRVNIVVPGFVDTDLWASFPANAREAMFRDATAKLPARRIGTPDDVAEHYLAFMRGGYTTGQSIVVDGGGVLA